MPVMEGKAVLFKEFGNVNAFPICLDTQDTEEIIKTVEEKGIGRPSTYTPTITTIVQTIQTISKSKNFLI